MDDLDRAARDLLFKFASSWDRGDAEALAALFDEDATFINIAAGLMQGRADIARGHAKGFAGFLGSTRIEFGEVTVRSIAPCIGLAIADWTIPGHRNRTGEHLPPRTGLLSVIVRSADGANSLAAGQNTQTAAPPPS